jgi:succinylglutamate desuccinylase
VIKKYISQFEALEKKYPGLIPDSICFNFGNHNGHIAFSSIIHGNEIGSLPSILKIATMLSTKELIYKGTVSFFLGNKLACLQNKRFLDFDLNRSFGNSLVNEETLEGKRAFDIKKILNQVDVYIDFHQTTMPCKEPFYIFAMHEKSYLWARAIRNSNIFITRKAKKPYSPEGMCSDEYMRTLNKAGITLELGEQGFHKNAELICFRAIKKALWTMDQIYIKKMSLKDLAHKNNDFIFLEIKHSEEFLHAGKALLEGFFNLQKIKKNSPMGVSQAGKVFYSPFDGYILFPQYPERNEKGFVMEALPTYIYTLASEIQKL